MLSIDSAKPQHRYLAISNRIDELEWRSIVVKFLKNETGNFSDERPEQMRQTISVPLTPTQASVVVIGCYADIPPNYQRGVVFDLKSPNDVEPTRAILNCGVYYNRLLTNELGHEHHAVAVLDFPEGIPKLVGGLPTTDEAAGRIIGRIGLCTEADHSYVSTFLLET